MIEHWPIDPIRPRTFSVRGFTLIEILVVMVIIAMMLSMAVVSIGDNFQRQMRSEAERLQSLMMAAADEAIYNASELGIYLTEDSYTPLRYDQVAQGWVLIEQRPFNSHKLPEDMRIDWVVEGIARPVDSESIQFEEIEFLASDENSDSDYLDGLLSGASQDENAAAAGSLASAVAQEVVYLTPQIYVLSSGEQTAFNVSFARNFESNVDSVITLVSDGFSAPYIKTESTAQDDDSSF